LPDGPTEETLDPDDWDALRALSHQMVDDMMDYLMTVRHRPVWQSVPKPVRERLHEPVPQEPSPVEAVYEQFKENIAPYPTGNIHPRFWGWVMGNGTPVAMLAEMLASGMNPHLAGYDQSAALVEQQVIAWMADLMGFPDSTSGLFVSGGTMANLLAVAVARNARAGFNVREEGLLRHPQLVIYASTETHVWVQKAAELLGLGRMGLRRIPVNADYEMDLSALRAAIRADRMEGQLPICVVATAGTVNTGATDDLLRIGDICQEEKLWFHVDAAFGGFAALSAKYSHVVRGIELADSLALDLHKWLYMPFEAGCVLVADAAAQRDAFTVNPSYLQAGGRGIAPEPFVFAGLGIDLSRSFKALKAWMSLKTYGAEKFGRLITQNIEQARYLEQRIKTDPCLELLAPVPLNIVCFRYRAEGLDDEKLNALNLEIMLRIQESGVAVPSSTVLAGRFALRVAITNHRSRLEDFDLLLAEVKRHGAAITSAS
jgi:glutamate/tyrosine decarboxylase-like PLP-dependent enzyme